MPARLPVVFLVTVHHFHYDFSPGSAERPQSLRYWDRLMGTEHPDYVKQYDRIQEQRFGVKATAVRAA